MTTPVETVSRTATVREAAATMHDHDINSLLVADSQVGIVTSSDVLGAVATGRHPEEVAVADVMTANVEWVEADQQLTEVAAMMNTYAINHLPVRDRHGDYVGMVSSTDLRELLG